MTIDKEARKNRVLEVIIKTHIKTASPIGSEYIAHILSLSSATIRNVMFELEKEGLVIQPYTSAGRIPTDIAYRRYVDRLKPLKEPSSGSIFSAIKKYFTKKRIFEEIIEEVSHVISEITSYTGIVLSPNNKLYFDGTYHMLEQPEFRELEMARDFLKIMEEREELANMMRENLDRVNTLVRIGRENAFQELRECSIVASTYRLKDRAAGNLGVIGPIRMRYEEVIPVVEGLAEWMTKTLEEVSA